MFSAQGTASAENLRLSLKPAIPARSRVERLWRICAYSPHNGNEIYLQGGFMRSHIFIFSCLLVLVGISAAQDSNFPVGSQYLMNYGSPIFARPIATPSLLLDTPLVASETISEDNVPAPDPEIFAAVSEVLSQVNLFTIYYGTPRVSVIELIVREPKEK